MESHLKTSLLLVPLSILLLSVLRIWQSLPESIDVYFPFNTDSQTSLSGLIKNYDCAQDYTIEMLSVDPLIIYINNFLSETEVKYLLKLSEDDFDISQVYDEDLKPVIDTRFRTSQSAMVPRNDTVGLCLSKRMKSILGNIQHINIEPIQVVKYEPSEEFHYHMDWFSKPRNKTYNPSMPKRSYNRLASIFAYLDDNCTGGETFFPRVEGVSSAADGEKFSRTESNRGLAVRPKRGNAVFWNNLLPNGTGDPRVAHAGLPVHTGRKIGINIFSHYFYDAPMVGGDEG